MYVDFSRCQKSNIFYGGSERKLGILFNGERYMLKFQKNTPFGKRFNHISEYLGSSIFKMVGIPVQEVFLGTYKKDEVVACKDFITDGYQFVPFNDVGESSLEVDKELYQYSYDDIIKLLKANMKITDVSETISSFFDIYIVDALIGNFDRHGANWGFLKRNNKYTLAPVFDNGSSLFPQMINEDEMINVIKDETEIDNRIYKFPTSQIQIHGRKSSYFDVISSLEFSECNDALRRIYPKIDIGEIRNLIDDLPVSDIHKTFYKTMIESRYEKIIKFSYSKLMRNENE